MNDETQRLEPWQWPEAHWRKLVGHVRAGRSYRPKTWKDGGRCAVALSFDADHETNELRDGGKSIGRLSWGQYGNRVAMPRILELLARHGVPATFYVPAVAALIHPDEQRRVVAEGHEIGIHGWIHELNSVLPYAAERDLMLRSADALEKITKVRPVGLRTPSWDFSPNTLAIEKDMGLVYDSSLMADEDLRSGRHIPAHHAPAHHRLPLAHLHRRGAHSAREVAAGRLVRDPPRGCRMGEGARGLRKWQRV